MVKRAHPPPGEDDVAAAVEALRAQLVHRPLLLLHDARLPSVTTVVAGAPIAGGWRAHPAGKLIERVLHHVADEVTCPKLVLGEETLVARVLWPELCAIGRADEPWQLHGLPREGRRLLDHVRAAGSVRTDRLRETGDGRTIGRAVDQLERRLLVATEQVHTADGKPARELSTWQRWAHRAGLAGAPLPSADEARARFEELVAAWPDAPARALPWTR